MGVRRFKRPHADPAFRQWVIDLEVGILVEFDN
jgi:hypothetical protein